MSVKELTFEEYEAMRVIEKLIFMKRQEIIKLEDRLRPYYDILEKTND